MIEILEAKDMQHLVSKIDEINERTKKHTQDIAELRRAIKELNK